MYSKEVRKSDMAFLIKLKIAKEYENYKQLILKQSVQNVFEKSFEIDFYKTIADYFDCEFEDFIEDGYCDITLCHLLRFYYIDNILDFLFDKFSLQDNYFDIADSDEVGSFLNKQLVDLDNIEKEDFNEKTTDRKSR